MITFVLAPKGCHAEEVTVAKEDILKVENDDTHNIRCFLVMKDGTSHHLMAKFESVLEELET